MSPVDPSVPEARPTPFLPSPQFVSPDTASHQGYASDGFAHYTIDTAVVYKRNDTDWAVIGINSAPWSEAEHLNHMGDGDYFQGRLYVPAERWNNCGDFANQTLLIFDAATLARTNAVSLSSHDEVSAVAVEPESGVLYISSYCNPSTIRAYQLPALSPLKDLELASPIPQIQGLASHKGTLYVVSDANPKRIYSVSVTDGSTQLLLTLDVGPGSYEGIDFSGSELRWLIDLGPGNRRVYYFRAAS